jgi:hypothetical protein
MEVEQTGVITLVSLAENLAQAGVGLTTVEQ